MVCARRVMLAWDVPVSTLPLTINGVLVYMKKNNISDINELLFTSNEKDIHKCTAKCNIYFSLFDNASVSI